MLHTAAALLPLLGRRESSASVPSNRLEIVEASILHDGMTIYLRCLTPVPTAYGGAVDWYEGWLANKVKTLSTGAPLAFGSGSIGISGGNLEWKIYLHLRPSDRIAYGESGITFSVEAGTWADSEGNIIDEHADIPLDNFSYMDEDGFLSPFIQPSGTAIEVYVHHTLGSDARSLATATNIATPLKSLKKAEELMFADPIHKSDGSHISIIEDIAEVRDASVAYPQLFCSGADRLHPHVIKPVSATGGRATKRARFLLTNAYGLVREGGGGRPAQVSNVIVSGLEFVNTDGTASVDPKDHIVLANQTDNICYHEIRCEKAASGFNVGTSATYVSLVRCIVVDSARAAPDHSHAIYADSWQGPNLISECNFDRCGYYNADRTAADTFSRNMYLSDLHSSAPTCYKGGFNTRSGAEAFQLRAGGGAFGILMDLNPTGGYVSGYGGRIAYCAWCRINDQLTLTPGVYTDRGWAGYINNGDTPTEGSLLEMNIVTPAIATHNTFNGRSMGFGGDGSGRRFTIRNNTARGAGPMFSFPKFVNPNFIDGTQPKELVFKNNLNDTRTGTRTHTFELKLLAAAGHGWLVTSGNGMYTSDPSKWGYVEGIDTYYSFAAFVAALGGVALSDCATTVPPDYASSGLDLISWYESKGGIGGEAGMYAAIRNREYHVWEEWNNWDEAVEYIQSAHRPTNKPARSGFFLDIEGCPVGIPEWAAGATDNHTGENIVESGFADGFMGPGRKLVMVFGDQNLAQELEGGAYEQFYTRTPNLKGYWVPGTLNESAVTPFAAYSHNTLPAHLGALLYQWQRNFQPSAPSQTSGLAYDVNSNFGDGSAGVASVGGGDYIPLAGHELIFPQSGPTIGPSQKFCSFLLASYGTSRDDWAKEALKATLFVHVPAANATGAYPIETGISLSVGVWRGNDAATISANLLGSAAPNTIVGMQVDLSSGAEMPRVGLYNAGSTNHKHRCFISGAMFHTATGNGLDMVVVGNPRMTCLDMDGAASLNFNCDPVIDCAQAVRQPTAIIYMLGQELDRQFPYVGADFDVAETLADAAQDVTEGLWCEIGVDIVHRTREGLGVNFYTGTPVLFCLPVFAGQVDDPNDWGQLHHNIVKQSRNMCDYANKNDSVSPEKWRVGNCSFLDLSILASPMEILLTKGEGALILTPGERFTGVYSSSTAYLVGDVAVDPDNLEYANGSHKYFIALKNHTNLPTTDLSAWAPVDFRWTRYFAGLITQYIIDEIAYANTQIPPVHGSPRGEFASGIAMGYD